MKPIRQLFWILLVGLAAIFLQSTVGQLLSPIVPNLLLLLVVFIGLNEIGVRGALLVFLLGLEFDLYSGLVLGPWAGAFVVVYLTLVVLSQRLFVDAMLVVIVAAMAATLLAGVTYYALLPEVFATNALIGLADVLSAEEARSSYSFWPSIFLALKEAVVTGLVAPIFFWLYRMALPAEMQSGSARGNL